MAKQKTSYICSSCGDISRKWAGRCPACQEWDSIEEAAPEISPVPGGQGACGYAGSVSETKVMSKVSLDVVPRISTGMQEFDRVLGGGLVPGSVVLLGGDPGVGKSTALLQICCNLRDINVLYVTGEESLQQIALRAKRLGMPDKKLLLAAETQVENICATATRFSSQIIVVDSIQTMQRADIQAAPGGVSQVRECAAYLTRYAKQTGTAIFLVGHVTKSGGLAGPRVLEHIIDVVCYFEGGNDSRYRIMRAFKNRYGAVNELGVFAMTESGLKEISNPSAIFLSRSGEPLAGVVVLIIWEGSRPLLVEVQALVDTSYSDFPRRLSVGIDQNRLNLLLAVLHKHGGVVSYDQDVYLNVVGGVKVTETSADLAVLLAITSSMQDRCLPDNLVVFGEVGLAGEIRPVPNGQERLREAVKHGFKQAIVPKANAPKAGIKGLKIFPVAKLAEALAIMEKM